MLSKKKIIESIQKLPEEVGLEEVIERIIMLDKIEKGLQQSKEGKTTPNDQLHKKLPEWLG